jgi:uncharacterized membrane protein
VFSLAEKKQETRHEEQSTLLGRSLLTGFIGGILACVIGIFLYYFNFIEVSAKSYVLRSWTTAKWTDTWLGEVVTIFVIGILSIGIAMVYYGILKKIYSIWMGILYGLILWGIVFYVLHPIFPNIPSVTELEWKTIVSSICLFVMYGTFIGYSISFDYHDTVVSAASKKDEKKATN